MTEPNELTTVQLVLIQQRHVVSLLSQIRVFSFQRFDFRSQQTAIRTVGEKPNRCGVGLNGCAGDGVFVNGWVHVRCAVLAVAVAAVIRCLHL